MNTNVFTPNGDGVNDIFYFSFLDIDEFEVIILNRWGNVVAEFDSSTAGWDGNNLSGKKCTEGVYFFILRYRIKGSGIIEKQGQLTLLR